MTSDLGPKPEVKPGKAYKIPPALSDLLREKGIIFEADNQIGGPGIGPSRADKLAAMRCEVCNTFFAKMISSAAYQKGLVIVQCPGPCKQYHLLADNIGWFHDSPTTIEDIFRGNPEKHLFSGVLNEEAVEVMASAASVAATLRETQPFASEPESSPPVDPNLPRAEYVDRVAGLHKVVPPVDVGDSELTPNTQLRIDRNGGVFQVDYAPAQ